MSKNVVEFIKKLKSTKPYIFEDGEASAPGNVTGNVDGYQTPNAFSKNEKEHEERMKDVVDSSGFDEEPSKKKKNFENVSEYRAIMSSMHSLKEASYKEFKMDQTKPTGRKINDSIAGIDRALREIERAVGHASRLKTEAGIDQRTLWKSSHSKLVKIHDRLVRIGKKINELGA